MLYEVITAQMSEGDPNSKPIPKLAKEKKQPHFNVRNHLYQVLGVDVTEIFGFKQTTALTVFSETGPDLEIV